MKWFWDKFAQYCLHGKQLSHILMMFIALWLILASSLIGLSLNTSWRLEERGMAINEAGSLRKRVFYIALLIQQPANAAALAEEYNKFQKTIQHLKLLREGGFDRTEQHRLLTQKLINIENNFQAFQHQVQIYQQHKQNHEAFLHEAVKFTQSINELVSLIESDNTRNIRLLRWLQYMLLGMAWISAFASLKLLHQLVLKSLHRLNQGIEQIRERQFYIRLTEQGTSEFTQVVHGFNLMASELSKVYNNLEGLVAEKTHALRKKNYELAILYELASIFQENHEQSNLIKVFIEKMMAFSGASAAVLQIKKRHATDFEVVGSNGLSEAVLQQLRHNRCVGVPCRQLINDPEAICQTVKSQNHACFNSHGMEFCLAFTIRSAEEEIGILNLFSNTPLLLTEEDKQLIKTVCSQFGIAIERLRLNQLDKHMAILEERNLMARGLHDSIAQSLSFLNMQVQVLTKAMQDDKPQLVQQTLNFIDEGVKECYADVRELLSNFRIRLAREGFLSAIQSVMKRFEVQVGMTVEWILTGEVFELDDDEQLQIIFIVQEALSNIRKHAAADQVSVILEYQKEYLNLQIRDNGIGFDTHCLQQKEQQGHVGTSIMRERASKIDGKLQINSIPGQGTTIELTVYRPYNIN